MTLQTLFPALLQAPTGGAPALPATTLRLRSDVDKGLTAPSTTLKLRTQQDKVT